MKIISRVWDLYTTYYLGYLIFAFILAGFCLFIPKSEGFLFVNQFHCRYLDYFFILFTNLGDGIFSLLITIIMLIRKKIGWALQIALSLLSTGLIVQIIKQIVHNPRPRIYFGSSMIHFIHGITRSGYGSFPSGHAATIFALTTLLSFYFPGKKTVFFFLIIAVMTGFSRIYLSQHFPVDVLVGSLIGVFISTLTFLFIPLDPINKKFSGNEFRRQSAKLR